MTSKKLSGHYCSTTLWGTQDRLRLISSTRLLGCEFYPWPGHTKDCEMEPIATLLGPQYSVLNRGVRAPNDSRVQPSCCPLLLQWMTDKCGGQISLPLGCENHRGFFTFWFEFKRSDCAADVKTENSYRNTHMIPRIAAGHCALMCHSVLVVIPLLHTALHLHLCFCFVLTVTSRSAPPTPPHTHTLRRKL